ncbi:MAG: hypothetical protein ABGX27_05140 [Desulfurobacteriaceae bacterium]
MRRKLVLGMAGLIAMSFGVFGCGGKKEEPKTSMNAIEFSTPWDDFCSEYSNLEGGIAACKCNFAQSIEEAQYAREEAVADARSELARILGIRVKNMVKRYKNRTVAGKKRYIGSTFEDVAKQVADKYLEGSRPLKYKTFRTQDGQFVACAVVGLQPQVVKEMIHEIAQKANLNNPRDEEILYEEFKAYKAQQELEKETTK